MPGAVAHTSTYALTNATFPYVMKIANQGWKAACENDESLAKGVHTVNGKLTEEEVAKAFGITYTPYEQSV
jgi:alanine dehydrogenase